MSGQPAPLDEHSLVQDPSEDDLGPASKGPSTVSPAVLFLISRYNTASELQILIVICTRLQSRKTTYRLCKAQKPFTLRGASTRLLGTIFGVGSPVRAHCRRISAMILCRNDLFCWSLGVSFVDGRLHVSRCKKSHDRSWQITSFPLKGGMLGHSPCFRLQEYLLLAYTFLFVDDLAREVLLCKTIIMADYAARGADFMKKADKKLNSFGLFSSFGNKYEDAAELLEKAANHFKLAKACECFMACSHIPTCHFILVPGIVLL